MVAAIGNGASFAKGRDFATWLGLVAHFADCERRFRAMVSAHFV
jgi:hypothetical protein